VEEFVRGDVVIIPFPFSDISANKKRPALVLAVIGVEDLLLCQITSRNRLDDRAIEIGPTDFAQGELSIVSYVRCGKLFAANRAIIERKAGTLLDSSLARIATKNADIILGKE
jgi:PemK-like protein.